MSAFAIVEPPASVVSVARFETVPPKVVSACVMMMRSASSGMTMLSKEPSASSLATNTSLLPALVNVVLPKVVVS